MPRNSDWIAVGFGLPNNHTVQNRAALSDWAQRPRIVAGKSQQLVRAGSPDDSPCAQVDGAEGAHVSTNRADSAPLMGGIIDLNPGRSAVRGAVQSPGRVDCSVDEEGQFVRAGRGLSESQVIRVLDAIVKYGEVVEPLLE